MKQHAAGALYERLDDDPGEFVAMTRERGVERSDAHFIARQVDHDLLRQQARK